MIGSAKHLLGGKCLLEALARDRRRAGSNSLIARDALQQQLRALEHEAIDAVRLASCE